MARVARQSGSVRRSCRTSACAPPASLSLPRLPRGRSVQRDRHANAAIRAASGARAPAPRRPRLRPLPPGRQFRQPRQSPSLGAGPPRARVHPAPGPPRPELRQPCGRVQEQDDVGAGARLLRLPDVLDRIPRREQHEG